MDWSNVETLRLILGEALGSQVAQFCLAFTIAAYIHSGRVKNEIKTQISFLVSALDNLGDALKQDLKSQHDRIENVETGVNKLTNRVAALEIVKTSGGTNGN
jgi:hypothetical protein